MENIQFSCSICNRVFTRNCALAYHLNHNNHKKFICLNCGKETLNKKFCCKSCAVKFNNSKRSLSEFTKNKISTSLKQKPKKSKELKKDKYCKSCGKTISLRNVSGFCKICSNKYRFISQETREKLSNAGKKSAQVQKNIKRSKNEILFSNLIHKSFIDSIDNEAIFNGWDADIIIPSLRIAILWNGLWHYKEITGQLKQVQNRDKIKYNEIIKLGYMPYIITDLGKFSKEKCLFEFKRFNEFLIMLKNLGY